MFFSSNIKLLRKRKRRTQDDLAHILKIKRSTLSGYENEVAAPSIQTLILFSEYFKISIDTLVKVDLMRLSESRLQEVEHGYDTYISGGKLRVLSSTVSSENEENIELVPEKAKAGYKNGYADPEYIKELPTFYLPFLSREKKYRTFQISGDSMFPIPEGAWVTGEFVQDWQEIKSNKAYIILTLDDGIVFKIVQNKILKERKLTLFSLNPMYEPYDLAANEISEIWKFTNYISAELPEPQLPKDDLITTIANLKYDMNRLKLKLGT